MYALYPDMEKGFQKDLDIVLKRIYDALEEKKKKDPKTYGHSKFSAEADTVQEIDNHLLHLIDELTYASKGAKNIANIGHKLHELFITPLKAIVTAIIAMKYGVLKKESWKRAWGESETWANRVYIGAMFALLGIEGFHALMAHGGNIAAILKSTFGSIDKLAAAAKNTIKASDMASATADDILALAGAGEEAVGAV
jgi:hypothetical protein